MEAVQDQLFESQIVIVDERTFVRCQLINCELRYSGGTFEMIDTMVTECRWAFGGAAKRTMQVLNKFQVLCEGEPARDEDEAACPVLPLIN